MDKTGVATEVWIEKHAPKKISELVGSTRQIGMITGWLSNYEKNRNEYFKKQTTKKSGKKNRKKKKIELIEQQLVDNSVQNEDDEPIENASDNEICADGADGADVDACNEIENNKPQRTKNNSPDIYSCMLLCGDHGCGKTSLVTAILTDMDYAIKYINMSTPKLKTAHDIRGFTEKILMGENVYDIIQKKRKHKMAIVIDDIESITKPTEKTALTEILQTNNELWACPVIFISSIKHKKVITGIKKDTFNVALYEPLHNDMMTLFVRICEKEDMLFSDETIAHKLIYHSQSDYRRMISMLQELKSLYGTSLIDGNTIEQYMMYSNKKDIDHTIYDDANKLFSDYLGISNALKIFERDKTNIPLMVQQNHLRVINEYAKTSENKLEIAQDIAYSIAKGDIVENYICSDQGWCLRELHGYYTCVYPSYKLNKSIYTEQLKRDSKYPLYNPAFQPKYPKDLNKTSTKKINYKSVKTANKYFGNMTINDYIFGIKIIKDLLDDDRKTECAELLKGYNATADIVIYILKIDKINGTKKEISKSTVKKIKDIFTDHNKHIVRSKYTKKR